MDSVKEKTSGDCITEEASSVDSDASDVIAICGDRKKLPRIGVQYQVEIPPLIIKSERLQLTKIPTDSGVIDNVAHSFIMGSPIQIMWVSNEFDSGKNDSDGTSKYKNVKTRKNSSSKEASKVQIEPSDFASDGENRSGSSEECKQTVEQEHKDKAFLVPGRLGAAWSDIEKESFLLGIYIFGKNLVQVKRFVEGKEMGDILTFYYGKFYRSVGHRKWVACRKKTSRRRTHGEQIFTGWRQQEILSRLLVHVPEKRQNALMEVSKTFGEGKVSLEEYISTIKAAVGLEILIEVIGIGKGKQDLTGNEPTRINQIIPSRHELPVGKAYSALKLGDIIRFVKGDVRLSKARSNDLFWEAVWPRLLAKGWRSEQPRYHTDKRYKDSLVFIIPGVKKFSKRKLVKGDHYFNSVTDVLKKVASDPRLLELEGESQGSIDNQENGSAAKKMKLDKGGHSNHHSYLQPQLSKNNNEPMKFTVVDTSLGDGEYSFSVRGLRSLPIESTNILTPTSLSSEKDEDGYAEEMHEATVVDMSSNIQGDSIIPRFTQGMPDNMVCQNAGSPEKGLRKTIICQFSRWKKPDQSNYLSPITKRQRFCSNGSFAIGCELREEELGLPSASENMVPEVRQSQDKISTSSSAKGNLDENSSGESVSHKKNPSQILIDLNTPYVPSLDVGMGEPFITEVENSQNDPSSKEAPFSSSDVASEEEQHVGIARRQSTRNRPLTTKALEAFACGFLNTKQKERFSLQAQDGIATRENIDGVAGVEVEANVEEGLTGFISNIKMVTNTCVP